MAADPGENHHREPLARGGARTAIAVLMALAGLWAYWPALTRAASAWSSNPDYTHGWLVPLLSAWLLYSRRDTIPRDSSTERSGLAGLGCYPSGLWLIAIAGVIRLVSGRLYLPELDAWSIPLWIGGVVWLLYGRAVFLWAAPPVAFLWFATPLPGTIDQLVSTPLQLLAANLSTVALQMLREPAVAEGTTVLLGEHVLDVERACSGLRMFYGVFALAVGYLMLIRPSRGRAIALLLATLPICIIANVVRITCTGLLVKYISGEVAHTVSHDLGGVLMIPLAIGMFVLFNHYLETLQARREDTERGAGPLLTKTVVVSATVFVAGAAWWYVQQGRVTQTLLATAERYEADGKLGQAVSYYNRYCVLVPEDDEAYAHLAGLYIDARGAVANAVDLAERAWQRSPERTDLVIEGTRYALSKDEPLMAYDLGKQALATELDETDRRAILDLVADAALALERSGEAPLDFDEDDVSDSLQEAVTMPGYRVVHAAELARRLRADALPDEEDPKVEQANALLTQLVSDYAENASVWLAVHLYQVEYAEDLGLSETPPLEKALELADDGGPGAAGVFLVASQFERQQERLDQAARYLERAAEIAPRDYRAYAALAELAVLRDDREAAVATLKQGLEAIGGSELWLLIPLASALVELERADEAIELLQPLEDSLSSIAESYRGLVRLGAGAVRSQIAARGEGPAAVVRLLKPLLNDPGTRAIASSEAPRLLAQSWSLLGQAYLILGAEDLAEDAFAEAALTRPEDPAVLLQAAMASMRSGDLRTAESRYRALLRADPKNLDAMLALVGIEAERQRRLSPNRRSWGRVTRALESARERAPEDPRVVLLAASVLSDSGNQERAMELLRSSLERNTDSAPLWRGMIVFLAESKDLEGALDAAERYVELSEESPESITMRASLFLELEQPDRAEASLRQALSQAPGPEEATPIAVPLARVLAREARYDEAHQVLREAHQNNPTDLAAAEAAASLAWMRRDLERLETCESWLREAEGEEGSLWRVYRVQRTLASWQEARAPDSNEALRLVNYLEANRPRWSQTHYLRGELAVAMNRPVEAVDAYERAWRLGGRSVLVADRLIDLLTRAGRFAEAQTYVGQVRDFLSMSPRLFDRSIPYFERQEEKENALRLAEGWVESQPDDPRSRMRLGRVLMVLASNEEDAQSEEYRTRAGQEFRKAVALAPNDVTPWVASLTFYAQQEGGEEAALGVLREFAQKVEIAPVERAFVLAQMSESLGQRTEAERYYQEAIRLATAEASPQEQAVVLNLAARFWTGTSPRFALRCARRANRLAPESVAVRRTLVRALASSSDPAHLEEAFSVLSEPTPEELDTWTAADRRLMSVLWYKRGDAPSLRRAAETLEDSLRKSDEDRRLLTLVYDAQERIEPALGMYTDLLASAEPRVQDLTGFLGFWQRRFVEAGEETPSFAGVAERVYQRLLADATTRDDWLRWKLREFAAKNESPIGVEEAQRLALEALGGAEDVSPQTLQGVLLALLQEGQSEAALRVVRSPPEGMPARQATGMLVLLLTLDTGLSENDENLHRGIVGLVQQSGDAGLMQSLADYRFMRGDHAEAEQGYRQVLAQNPGVAIVYNNLALALSEQPGREAEALEIVEQAVKDFPDDANLHDTHGLVLGINGRWEEASSALAEALRLAPGSPAMLLHLAQAEQSLLNEEKARARLFEAYSLGLEREVLSPRDRRYLDQLDKLLETPDTSENVSADQATGQTSGGRSSHATVTTQKG